MRPLFILLICCGTLLSCKREETPEPKEDPKRVVQYLVRNTTGVHETRFRDEFGDIDEGNYIGDVTVTREFNKGDRLFLECDHYLARMTITVNGTVIATDNEPPQVINTTVP